MIPRIFEGHLLKMLSQFPVVALTGPRQVGKSTLAQVTAIGAARHYVTMDDLASRAFAQHDPQAFLAGDQNMTIDEIQLAPDLLREIKIKVDQDRRPGRYLITGSADLNYAMDLSNVLAGRVGLIRLPPITNFELAKSGEVPAWALLITHGFDTEVTPKITPFSWDRLYTGGFPLSLLSPSDSARRSWLESFRATYLERDLRRLSDIGRLFEFSRLMELTASRTSSILNQAALARDAGLNAATAGRYLSILEAGHLIHRLPPWYTNIGKRLVKSPKLHWLDSGLAAYLTGLERNDFPVDRMTGPLFESLVAAEIYALLPIVLPEARLFYLRSHDGLEIDLVIRYRRRLIPIEVKAAESVGPADAKPIERWLSLSGQSETGMIIYAGRRYIRISRNVVAVPF